VGLYQVLAAQEALDALMRGNFSSSEELEKALAQTVLSALQRLEQFMTTC